jgi:hypothetical protein
MLINDNAATLPASGMALLSGTAGSSNTAPSFQDLLSQLNDYATNPKKQCLIRRSRNWASRRSSTLR